jgi:hypothetical protein
MKIHLVPVTVKIEEFYEFDGEKFITLRVDHSGKRSLIPMCLKDDLDIKEELDIPFWLAVKAFIFCKPIITK